MSTPADAPAVGLAERQLERANSAHTEARTKYDDVQKRIADLADDAETTEVEQLAAELETAGQELEDTHAEVERVKGNLETAKRRAALPRDAEPVRHATARGSQREELTYRPDLQHERSFFTDAYAAEFKMDSGARERIERHAREMVDEYREKGIQLRDVGTGAFTGLVAPVYLEEEFVAYRRAGFPLYDWLRKVALPPTGMTVNIGRLTTGTAAAAQASENSAVQETDSDDTLLTVNVRTYAGQQDVSRQAIERGALVDQVIYEDLTRAYFTKLGDACYNADGTSGTHLGISSTSSIISVAYTDASPTVPELWPKLQDAIQQINAGIFAPANVIVMHPRRWGWLQAAVDSSNRPYVLPAPVAYNALGTGNAAGYGTPVGSIGGLPIVTDGNIATTLGGGTEDQIFVLATSELFFWQEGDGMPRRFQFEQSAAPQSIRLAVWGYSAFTAGRLTSASAKIGGTGLASPSF